MKLSIRTKFNLYLAITLLPFVIISVVFMLLLSRNKEYESFKAKVLEVKLEYQQLKQYEQSFLLNYESDNTFFKTGENEHLRKFELLDKDFSKNFDILLNSKTTQTLNLEDRIYILKENASSYNDLLNVISKKIYQRGSYQTGIIGEMERSYENAKNENLVSPQILAKLKECEMQYLYRKDVKFYNDFITTFTKALGGINIVEQESENSDDSTATSVSVKPVSISLENKAKYLNDFKRYFTSLVKIEKEIGFSPEEGLRLDLEGEKTKLDEMDSLLVQIDEAQQKNENSTRNLFIWATIFLIVVILIVIRRLTNTITKSITNLKEFIEPLSKGILPETVLEYDANDELSEMAKDLNAFASGLKKTTKFATEIGSGNFDTDFSPLSDEDQLGNSLLEMRQNLAESQEEEEKRKNEDDLRKWSNEGLTKFNEILRQTNDIDVLANNVIRELIHFLKANQGGLFLVRGVDQTQQLQKDLKDIDGAYLELAASYAYNQERKKKKKIFIGEGLVGTCAVEKSYVYLTDVPGDYLTITSGLGSSTCGCLLIMPLQTDNKVFGVLEIASFKRMDKHEIDFVETLSESIASTINITQINQTTKILLAQSQQKSEEMASKEEEMRQNMEELQATQEESKRKEAENQSLLSAINATSLVFEFELSGRITKVNEVICRTLNLQSDQIVGHTIEDFRESNETQEEINDFWNRVKDGSVEKRTDKIVACGESHWLQQVFSPIFDADGFPYKVLSIATDITSSKLQEIELTEQTKKMTQQEDIMRQNLEELQATQEAMSQKQAEIDKANRQLKENETVLKGAIEKSKLQESELQDKVNELNNLHKELAEQQQNIIAQNEELQEKEKLQAMALQAADKNLERIRLRIMADFVRNLERQCGEMDDAEKFLAENKDVVPKETIEKLHDVNLQFKVLISKYKLDEE